MEHIICKTCQYNFLNDNVTVAISIKRVPNICVIGNRVEFTINMKNNQLHVYIQQELVKNGESEPRSGGIHVQADHGGHCA